MNPESILAGTASLFMALGDKTRLRLLNLMREREICVSSFTDILEQSQPLISRHLAYLRNGGLVEARRDGKWMHYSISADLDEKTRRLLIELFKWMEDQEGLRIDREKYRAVSGESPVLRSEPRTSTRRPRQAQAEPPDIAEVEPDESTRVRHNEIEDFLL
jgi:ArsR family transcriptional regulator, arsenate/arsenite/antimonite-responsive transcriptional repressor